MSVRYENLESPRYTVASVGGREEIRLRPKRPLFVMAFLPFWLCAWTVGGVAVGRTMMTKQPSLFLVFWLCLWAVGWAYAATQLAWLLGGSETLGVQNGDLGITYRVFGFPIKRTYRGGDVRNLTANASNDLYRRYGANMPALPFLASNKSGSIKFSYGARTIYAGGDLDEEEGHRIVALLLRRLPASAKPQGS